MKKKINFGIVALLCAFSFGAHATEISMNTAVMQAMDKITGHVNLIEVPVNQEVMFGSFSILVRDCKTRAPEETPENFAFVDIVDNVAPDTKFNIFKGWMMSSSPALNPVAHPVYDVWLLKCKNTPDEKIKPMSAKDLLARDEIEIKRDPKKEYVSLSQDVYESIETELVESTGEPENLIPVEVSNAIEQPEEQTESNVVENNTVEEEVKDSAEDANLIVETEPENYKSEDSSAPEALIIIKEEPKPQPEPIETDTIIEPENSTDIIELEKELSEKAIND